MKKIITIMLVLVLLYGILVGCGEVTPEPPVDGTQDPSVDEPIVIGVDPEPMKDITEEIIQRASDAMIPLTEKQLDEAVDAFHKELLKENQNAVDPELIHYKYCGIFNGYIIMRFVPGPTIMMVVSETIADVIFTHPSPCRMRGCKNGRTYDLQTLYDKGELSREDILAIKYNLKHPSK